MTHTKLVIHRFDPTADRTPYLETFEVPAEPDYTVLDALSYVQAELDPGLSFRSACRNWMCGSCGLRVNGRPRLACKTPLRDLPSRVLLEPLRNLPVIKDLVTDMAPFFVKWRAAMNAFVPVAGSEKAPISKRVEDRRGIDKMIECIGCALCYSACTMVVVDPNFLGPAALTRAYVLVEDRRDAARPARLAIAASEAGVFRCHAMSDCQDVCPKDIAPIQAIQELKQRAVKSWKS